MTVKQTKVEIQSWNEVPDFSTESEEDAFWGTHRLSDALLAEMVSGPGDADLPASRGRGRAQPISVRLDEDLLRRLKTIARRRGVGYQTLLKHWLSERLALEEARGGPPRDSTASNVNGTQLTIEATAGPRDWAIATEEIASVMALLSRELADLARIASIAPIAPHVVRDAVQNYRRTLEREVHPAGDELRSVLARMIPNNRHGD